MKTAPVRPARIGRHADGMPVSLDHGDIYHPRAGALAQARHVFLAGNGLPTRWRGRARFVVLETGFGLGHNFLATWAAWRDDPERPTQLHFVSVEASPPDRATLAGIEREPTIAALAAELVDAWPPLTWNLHRLSFEGGAVELLLAFGDAAAWLPQLTARVDAFFLDGFAPARNPAMWDARVFATMARLAAPAATAATWTAARGVRAALAGAGFAVRDAPGQGGKRDITLARFEPRVAPPPLPRLAPSVRIAASLGREPVVIVGAGLAGCATAWALAERGVASIVLDRRAEVAAEGSGNAGGLFHGVVHRADGRHARWHRAGALATRDVVAHALAAGVRGGVDGLLRLEPSATDATDMQATIDRLGLPDDYVRAVAADVASALAGTPIASPAWAFAHGGWVDPRGLSRSFLARAGSRVDLRLGRGAARLRRDGDRWCLDDSDGATVASASVVVLANAGGALALLGDPGWPMAKTRGQLSAMGASEWPAGSRPRLPIAGAGYVLPASEGAIWFGASSQAGDDDGSPRGGDHVANLERLATLLVSAPRPDVVALTGRTGFRWSSDDRLPVIGAVPAASVAGPGPGGVSAGGRRQDQPRFVPRAPGLFVITALGSRGIASASLGGPVLAALITGAPVPLEADLLDAVDPARFVSRAVRRASAAAAAARTKAGAGAAGQPPVGPIDGGSAGA